MELLTTRITLRITMNSYLGKLTLVGAACAIAGGLVAALAVSPNAAPRIEEIQGAYEREAAAADARHSKSLSIRSAQCAADRDATHLCWIQFTEGDEPAAAIQFDVVVVSRTSAGWRLDSGLCKQ